MNKTNIDWCDMTWNPVTGCLHKCRYCYAREITRRFSGGNLNIDGTQHMPGRDSNFEILSNGLLAELESPLYKKSSKGNIIIAPYPYGFYPTFHKYRLAEPINKRKSQNIFVCSMADLFGDWVPDEWINQVFKACRKAPQHNYLFLTKNPERYESLVYPLPNNFWFGITATDQDSFHSALGSIMQHTVNNDMYFNHFLSIEPIQEKIIINELDGYFSLVDWVIIGAETGNHKGKIIPKREWIEHIVNRCKSKGIPVFMKASLHDIWGKKLIQEYPGGLGKGKTNEILHSK